MTTASPASQTAQVAGQAAAVLADAPHQAAAAASRAALRAALAQAERAEHAVTGLRLAIVADLLASGTDWWQAGEALAMHPQAAFEAFAYLAPGQQAPAAQRPDLAIVLTRAPKATRSRAVTRSDSGPASSPIRQSSPGCARSWR